MVAISSLEQGTLVGDRYRLVEPMERFTPAAGGPSGAGFGYWLALDETRGREVWLLFAENRGRAASGADVAGAVSVLRRLGHRAVPAVPDFGEVEFDAAEDAIADGGAGEPADAEPVVETVGYAVLEPIEGESLSALLLRGALTEAEIFAVLLEVAQLLRVLHAAELVHGHLSIYSVLVAESGVRVVDLPASLALESAFDSGLSAAADVYAFCWLACLALVGVDVVEAELGAGYDAGSSPEDAYALAFLTADVIARRRAWAETALVDVYGLREELAVLLVAGLGEASQRPAIEVIAELLHPVEDEAVEVAGLAGAAGLAAAAAVAAEAGAAEARGEMIGIVAGEAGYEVQVGRLPEAAAGGEVVEEVEETEVEEESVVAAEAAGPEDTSPTGAEAAAAGAAGGIAIAAAMAAEAATVQSSTAESATVQVVETAEETSQATAAPVAAAATAGAAGAVVATEMAAAASTGRSGGVGVARRPAASPMTGGGSGRSGSGSGGSGSGSGGSGSGGPTTPSSPVAFTAGAHRRPPKSAVLVAAGITVLIIAAGAWALAEHKTVPSSPSAGASSSASGLAQSSSTAGGGAGSSAGASVSASASASHASPTTSATAGATGSPAAGGGPTPSAAPTTPSPGPLATVPSSPSQALSQIKQAISQAQALGQYPAAAQGPFNQAVSTLQQEISGGSSTAAGASQLQSALNTPGLPAWFTSQMNQLIPYLTPRPGS